MLNFNLGCQTMTDLDLMTDEQLVETLRDRLEAKGLAYLFAWGLKDGEEYALCNHTTLDMLNTIYEDCIEDLEEELYSTDTWDPSEEELLQWKTDSEDPVDEEED